MPAVSAVSVFSPVVASTTIRKKVENELPQERLIEIAKEHPVVNTFLKLAVIPSPSIIPGHPKENEMKEKMNEVRELTKKLFIEIGAIENNIEADENGSLIIRIPGTAGYEHRQPLLLMGHLDIVPADKKNPTKSIHPKLIKHKAKDGNIKDFIATDGTTTLGADDKALVAPIWDVVRRLKIEGKPHVPIEIVLVPDEETTCDSLINLDTKKLKGKNILVADNFTEFEVTNESASFYNIQIEINGLKGGHSASDNQEDFVSATDVLKELHDVIGNRVLKWRPKLHQPLISKNIYKYEIEESPSNAFPTKGYLSFSLRGNDHKLEEKEIERIKKVVSKIEKKYKDVEKNLQITIKIKQECPLWKTSPKSPLVKMAVQAAKEIGQNEVIVKPEHGATQVNNLVGKRNFYGEEFDAIIVGANLEDAHSVEEKVEIDSILKLSDWIYKFVQIYSSKSKI